MEPSKTNKDALTENTLALDENTDALNNPVEAAVNLTEALNANTKALNKVKNRYRYVLIFVACLALVLGFEVKAKHDGEVSSCRRGNELRTLVNDKFVSISDLFESNTPPENVTDVTRQFFALLNDRIPTRNCGDIGWL